MKLHEWLSRLIKGGLRPAVLGDGHVRDGLQALDRKDYHQARNEFEHAIRLGVKEYNLEEVYTLLGKSHKELGRFEEAITAHRKALELKPDYHKAWNNLGIAYRESNQYDEAKKCFERAIELDETYAFAYACLGTLYIYRNEPQEAIRILERAVTLNLTIATAYGNLALAYAMVGRVSEAKRALSQAVALGYDNWQEIKKRIEGLEQLHSMDFESKLNTMYRKTGMSIPGMVKCTRCGQHNALNVAFCVKCGAHLGKSVQ